MSPLESLGLLLTLTLGGLGMFLVVLVVTFVFAKIVTKPAEFERFGEADVTESEEYFDTNMHYNDNGKDIFIIEDVEGCIINNSKEARSDDCPAPVTMNDRPSKLVTLSNLWHSLASGRLKENIFGSKFIELQP